VNYYFACISVEWAFEGVLSHSRVRSFKLVCFLDVTVFLH
jgi:hypothetical protein